MMAPRALAAALGQAHRKTPGRPVAANLLVPFIKGAHLAAWLEANASLVVLHGGFAPRAVARLSAGALHGRSRCCLALAGRCATD